MQVPVPLDQALNGQVRLYPARATRQIQAVDLSFKMYHHSIPVKRACPGLTNADIPGIRASALSSMVSVDWIITLATQA